MLPLLLLSLALAPSINDPVDAALASFQKISTYRVTIRSKSGGSSQILRYLYKRPGFVRMEFIKPRKGAILVYNPATKKVRLRPFAFLSPLVLTLDPDNALITGPQGHRVDASDLGSFLETVKGLADRGKIRIIGADNAGGGDALLVEVTGDQGVTVAGGVHRYLLWLDAGTLLPVRTCSYDAEDNLVEDVLMDDLEVDVALPDRLFEL